MSACVALLFSICLSIACLLSRHKESPSVFLAAKRTPATSSNNEFRARVMARNPSQRQGLCMLLCGLAYSPKILVRSRFNPAFNMASIRQVINEAVERGISNETFFIFSPTNQNTNVPPKECYCDVAFVENILWEAQDGAFCVLGCWAEILGESMCT